MPSNIVPHEQYDVMISLKRDALFEDLSERSNEPQATTTTVTIFYFFLRIQI
jgi:hypothetical protein